MSEANLPWARVSRQQPCGVCGKFDWCTIGQKGWCCMRVDSDHPMKNGGYFFPFEGEKPKYVAPIRPSPDKPKPDFKWILGQWKDAMTDERMTEIAAHLGVSAASLEMLNTSWSGHNEAIAFPMYDGTCSTGEKPCGIRLRTMGGAKFAITGTKSGVFFPYGALKKILADRIFICEGPTDTAACLDMGLFAIGRASCRGGEDMVLNILWQLGADECVVVSDNDGPGVEGATALMSKITIPKTRLVPPGKDLRAFVRDGGNRSVLDALLKNLLRK